MILTRRHKIQLKNMSKSYIFKKIKNNITIFKNDNEITLTLKIFTITKNRKIK